MTAPPAPPYIPAKYHGGSQSTIVRIVIHGTVSATERGGARAIAEFFKAGSSETSAHYVVDPGESIQCVYDHTIAYHDGTNTNSIGVELCDPVDGPPGRWEDKPHQEMLHRAADLVRQLCDAYGVAKRKLDAEQIRAGEKGICGHADMRDAFPGSTSHYDPGAGFPWRQFIDLVAGSAPEAAAPETAAPEVARPEPGARLRYGDKGPAVSWLQNQLNADLKTRPGIPVTGTYDAVTRTAVTRFQREQKLGMPGTRWLGVADAKTVDRLRQVEG